MGIGLRMIPLLSCLAILCAVAPQCSAYDEADQRRALQESTETVSVGIYILSIGEVNSEKGTFDADFYLYLSSDTMTRYYQGSCPRNDQSCPGKVVLLCWCWALTSHPHFQWSSLIHSFSLSGTLAPFKVVTAPYPQLLFLLCACGVFPVHSSNPRECRKIPQHSSH